MGNRFDHLQEAVNALFLEVGSIKQISSVYQTPALGFEGADFLNCVLWLQTNLSPQTVLEKALAIEKRLGRTRGDSSAPTSRPIDIDLLFVDDQIIESKDLQIPHPEMAHRKFVLHPMAEISPNWVHPVLGKNMVWMLAKTEDKSELKKLSKWLRNPKKEYAISNLNYLVIEGNIGAGKTSLAQQISADFNAKLILERFQENPFLPKFYKESTRYAFPLEMSFLADRYQQLLEDLTQYDLFSESIVADYDVYKSMIFAQITLSEEEYTLYKKLFHLMYKELPKPKLYVYLYQTTERLLENIKKRGREYEQSIEATYLSQINEGYLEFIKSQHLENVKIIDVSNMDFVENRKDYLTILKEIQA